MKVLKNIPFDDQLGYETPALITKIQAFVDYAEYVCEYACLVENFFGLTKKMLEAVDVTIEHASIMRDTYWEFLTQVPVENLLKNEVAISADIENIGYSLALMELSLDKYLVFADTDPPIPPNLVDKNGLPVFNTSKC